MGMPKPPTPPPLPPPPLAAHPESFGAMALAGTLEKQKASLAEGKGMDNTVLTSGSGLSTPNTARPKIG